MAQAAIGFATLAVVVAVMVTLSRRTKRRMHEMMAAEQDGGSVPLPAMGNKKVLAEITPAKPRPTIQDLVDEEAAATGVNEIPGGEDLNVSLKLRVFWRDEVVRKGCRDGHLEFRVDQGVNLDSMRTEDVRLVCVRSGSTTQTDTEAPKDVSE
ncbi:MAG: hypothetical protein GY720_04635 [bacterium]|nr:hypothetical protein [bacterium]